MTPTLALFGAHSSQQAEGFRQAEIPKFAPSVVVAAACDDLEILLTLEAPSAWVLYSKAGETAASKLMVVK